MKFKRILTLLLILSSTVLAALPVGAAEYNARAYILMEASTGLVMLEENADEALPPASVTKIMTLLVVMEAVAEGRIGWEDTVRTSEYAASMGGSQVYLEPGEEMTVAEMVKCVVVASANDAAVALAEAVAGSEEAFVKRMNERAAELGMTNTVFLNTNGLDDTADGHVTSARDIAIMSRELITKHPQILEYSSIWMDTIRGGAFGLTNTNRLIRFYAGANGLKTGSTSKAKFCISATAERNGMQLIAVVMASPTRDERNETAKKLLDYGFANYEVAPVAPTAPLDDLRVLGGVADTVRLGADETSLVLPKGQASKLTQQIYLPEYISAPVKAGDEVGKIEFFIDGEVVATLPVTAAENVEKIGYFGLFSRFMKKMLLVEV
ncbi:MAG: D-alanyl-D-alanine carboxypeptidase [Clostridia bacterium]|nr:D-alanyl-D-alanine carboxypeptidase [Clostridia bacterium]